MAGNENSGGHNARVRVPLAGVLTGTWPWDRARKVARWPAEKIRRYLEQDLAELGIVTDGSARDILTLLADAYHVRLRARIAILESEDGVPRVGKRDAFAVQALANNDVQKGWRLLGVYPLKRPVVGNAGEKQRPPIEEDADAEFGQPVVH